MEFAVIRTAGKQYKVSPGDLIEVDKLPVEVKQEVVFDEVLLWVSNGEVRIGTPLVPGVKVRAHVLEQKKGQKVRVQKFRAKVRYRRVMGFRPMLTRVKIEKIERGVSKKITSQATARVLKKTTVKKSSENS